MLLTLLQNAQDAAQKVGQAAPPAHEINHLSLAIQLPEIIGIPLGCLAVMTMIKGDTTPDNRDFGTQDMVEIAMDLAIIATGASGSVFANDVLYEKWKVAMVIYGIFTVLLSIFCVLWLARIRRYHNEPPVTIEQARKNIMIGFLPVSAVTLILILGYTLSP